MLGYALIGVLLAAVFGFPQEYAGKQTDAEVSKAKDVNNNRGGRKINRKRVNTLIDSKKEKLKEFLKDLYE